MIGVGLAALAGVLIAPIAGVHPAMGQEIITPPSSWCVIGGLGSFWGVVVAACWSASSRASRVAIAAHYPGASTAAIYLHDAARAAGAAARPVRRTHPAVRVRRCAPISAIPRGHRRGARRPALHARSIGLTLHLGDRGRDLRASPAWR
jgi:hypothetical protein